MASLGDVEDLSDDEGGYVVGAAPPEDETGLGQERVTNSSVGDRREIVHDPQQELPLTDDQRRERLKKGPWKNYFLVATGPGKRKGTAFLTNLKRSFGREEYAVLLTCAHVLSNKRMQQDGSIKREMVENIRLYRGYDLSRERHNVSFGSFHPCLNLKRHDLPTGWFCVFRSKNLPSYLEKKSPEAEVGAIFVKMDCMSRIMENYGGMEDRLIVAPGTAPNPAKDPEKITGFVAGYPGKYGGEDGEKYPTHYLLTCDGKVLSSQNRKNYTGKVEMHDADTTPGNSGSPFVVGERDCKGTVTYYAVGIHFVGFSVGTSSEPGDLLRAFYGRNPVPDDVWAYTALNLYRFIDSEVVQWATETAAPEP